MSSQHPVLLVVDDEPFNLEIIAECLDGLNYELVTANSGNEAWAMLQAEPERYDAVILDRMMPGIDGIEVLRYIKRDEKLKVLPVIIQTAASAPEQIAEGLREGAFYYLTKPFQQTVLRAVVGTALRDYAEAMRKQSDEAGKFAAVAHLEDAIFNFRTTDEARQIADFLACLCPAKESAYLGLMELMLNAVEHGNLGITYEEKTALIQQNALHAEVHRRLALPEYAAKVASVRFRRTAKSLIFNIIDEGNGFDWKPFLEMSMDRLMHNHGRGIAMSRSIAFTSVRYSGNGNRVEAEIMLTGQSPA